MLKKWKIIKRVILHPRRLAYIILNNVTLFALFTHFFCYSQFFFSQFTAQKAFFFSFFPTITLQLYFSSHFTLTTFTLDITTHFICLLLVLLLPCYLSCFMPSHFPTSIFITAAFNMLVLTPIHTWSSCSRQL